MKRNFSVRSLLLIVAVSFTTLPVLLFGLYEAFIGVQSAKLDALELNRSAALLVARDLQATVDEYRALFEGIALDVNIDKLQVNAPERMTELLKQYPKILGVLILDKAVGWAALLAIVCALVGAAIASAISFSTVRGIDHVAQQIERMSVFDLKPIELAHTSLPKELKGLVANVNNLIYRTSRARFAEFEAIAKVGDMILIAGPSGQITYANEAGIRLFGNVAGHSLKELIGPGPAAEIYRPQEYKEWKADVSLKRPDGTAFDGFLSSTPILDEGKLTSVVTIIHDITREKAAREAVIQSEKMITLGELVAGTSHELNNPLAIVTGYSDLLLEDLTLNRDQRTKVESIRKNAMRAASVVHSLLAFARKRKPQPVRGDVNLFVEEACRLKEYDLRTSGIQFDKRLGEGLPEVLADPHQIQQVLLNVINNAQDAASSSKTPRVVITTEASTHGIVIRVEDSGAGIPQGDLKKVFDPFFTTKPVGKGTGLGLSVSYGIIREHGGDISIASNAGEGTCVSISLPAASSRPESSSKPAFVLPSRTIRILVVDDEPEIASILKTGLTREGTLVDAAETPADAVALAEKAEYDVILTDIKMPAGSGIDLFHKLCSINPSYRNRTVFITGDTSNPATMQFFENEGLPYFSKPFDYAAMERLLRQKGMA